MKSKKPVQTAGPPGAGSAFVGMPRSAAYAVPAHPAIKIAAAAADTLRPFMFIHPLFKAPRVYAVFTPSGRGHVLSRTFHCQCKAGLCAICDEICDIHATLARKIGH